MNGIRIICANLVQCEAYAKNLTCEHNEAGLYEVDIEYCPCFYGGSCPPNYIHKEEA